MSNDHIMTAVSLNRASYDVSGTKITHGISKPAVYHDTEYNRMHFYRALLSTKY